MKTKVSEFYYRPYLIIYAKNFADEIRKSIVDRDVKEIELEIDSVY